MFRYIIKRIILLIPVIIVVSFLVFLLMELAPGSPIDVILANMGSATDDDIAALRASFDLDKPLLLRYAKYMLNLVQGNLGTSDISGINVWDTYISRLPYTLALAFGGIIIGATVAIPLGIRAARRAGRLGDSITTMFTMVGMSMPSFWLAILLIMLFSNTLGWLPAGDARHGFKSFILPCICSGLMLMATCTRQTRSSMLEVLNADFLRTAKAKGVPESAIIKQHALGNAWIPIMTNIGTSLSISLAGSAVIEAAFTWPGVGRMIVEAVIARDVKTATGSVIMTSIIYVFINLLVDLAYGIVDPRLKSQYSGAGKRKSKSRRIETDRSAPEKAPCMPMEVETHNQSIIETVSSQQQENSDATEIKTAAATSDSQAKVISGSNEQDSETLSSSGAEYRRRSAAIESQSDNEIVNHREIMKKYKKRSRFGEIIHHLSKNKGAMTGLIIIAALLVALLLSVFFISFDSVTKSDMPMRFSAPGQHYPFGTDNMGRDQFLRVIYGTRYSLLIGLCGAGLSAIAGIVLGSLAGYFGKVVEDIIMRVSDVLASIPGLLLGMVIVTVLGQSIPNLIIAIGIPGIHIFVRITRASVLSVKGNEYVEASRAIGISHFRIIFSHVLPNGLAPIIVQFTTMLGTQILVGASLSFLGFGVPVPHPEWGTLVAYGRSFIRNAPWLTTFPGVFIMITVLAFNLLGDGLRDALDPKLKK